MNKGEKIEDDVKNKMVDSSSPESNQTSKSKERGVINPKIVRRTCFLVITLSLLACAVLCIMSIWEYAEHDVIWRSIATLGVVSVTAILFSIVNEKFG